MKKVKLGVFGVGRGGFAYDYCKNAENAELVAVCDMNEAALGRYKELGIATYTDFNDFIKHEGLEAVCLANFATEHAPYAIKAMKAGKHILSEVLPFQTMKEAVELIETVEETGLVYAYAENYAYMPCNVEMRRLIKEGILGDFEYGEGEYLHNCEPGWHRYTRANPEHWRNTMYSTFYCTHSAGPLIHIAGQRPVKVTGFEVPFNKRMERMGAKAGPIGIEMIELESGALIKSAHGVGVSKNSYWFCTYGSKGRAEAARESAAPGTNVKVLYTNIDDFEGQNKDFAETKYCPIPSTKQGVVSNQLGHGGGDYYVFYHFFEKILGRENDSIDVYEGADMFLTGMFAYRSILAGGIPMEIPNLRIKEERDKWRNDTTCTDPKVAGDMLIPSYKEPLDIPQEMYNKLKEKLNNE